jgi:hypothetical protein
VINALPPSTKIPSASVALQVRRRRADRQDGPGACFSADRVALLVPFVTRSAQDATAPVHRRQPRLAYVGQLKSYSRVLFAQQACLLPRRKSLARGRDVTGKLARALRARCSAQLSAWRAEPRRVDSGVGRASIPLRRKCRTVGGRQSAVGSRARLDTSLPPRGRKREAFTGDDRAKEVM